MSLILAVQPESSFSSLTLNRKTCPLGLLTILSSNNISTNDAIVFNEDISGKCESVIHDKYNDVEIVLMSINSGNTERGLYLSKYFSSMGKRVYLGGPEISLIGPSILKYHPDISGIIIGPGENTFKYVINNIKKNKPPFYFIKNNNNYDLSFKPTFKSIDFNNVNVNYNLLYDLDKYQGLSYLWGNDCHQAYNRCFFCGRLSMGIGYRPANIVWSELKIAYQKGIKFFYNTTDSVTTNIDKFYNFCKAKPNSIISDEHRVFVNSKDVNGKLIESLKYLNGIAVIGIESFSNFQKSGKKFTTSSQNRNAIDLLYNNGIKLVLSFVYGLPGETLDSLDYNNKMIIQIVENYGDKIDAIHISPLLITTGSPAYNKLMSDDIFFHKYRNGNFPFDVVEMSNDYFNMYCNISRTDAIQKIFEIKQVINAIAPHIKIGAKGILKSEEKYYSRVKIESESALQAT